jgi:hypothetical protein
LLIIALANWQAVETFKHGSIFEKPRAWLEARGGFISDLLLCAFCLSHWTGLLLVVLHLYDINTPAYVLSAIRVSQLLHDLFHSKNRIQKDIAFDFKPEEKESGTDA